jgi:glutathione S-transferase
MALTLYHHPLSSFCWKVSIALQESGIPFEPRLVDLGDGESRRRFLAVWPLGKMPVLHDSDANRTIPETTIILDYLAARFPSAAWLLSGDAEMVREIRLRDRFFDQYVHQPMQKIVTDRLRPAGQDDAFGVETARKTLRTALDFVEARWTSGAWAAGEAFSMADCAAAPALFYADKVAPFRSSHPDTWAYLQRALARPSFRRVLEEAQPFMHLFPAERRTDQQAP